MTKEQIENIANSMQELEVKKLFKINENGNKVKVRRDSENEYSIYLNGNFVTTDSTWQEASDLALVLINSK